MLNYYATFLNKLLLMMAENQETNNSPSSLITSLNLPYLGAPSLAPFQLLTFHLVALHFLSVVLTARTILTLLVVFTLLLTLATNLKLGQIRAYGGRHILNRNRKFTETQFSLIRRHFAVALLTWLADINRIYGRLICCFIGTTLPLNALLVMMLIFSAHLSLKVAAACVVIAAFQVTFLFGLSLFAARQAGQFHGLIKGLLGLSVRVWKTSSSSGSRLLGPRAPRLLGPFRLKVALFIEHFHTRNPYTLNLGSLGKVDFAFLRRLLFFYFKFLIFAFKLMSTR